MKVTILKRFGDKFHFPTKYLVGDVATFDDERAKHLIKLGVAEKYKEEKKDIEEQVEEQVEEPKVEKPKVEKPKVEKPVRKPIKEK